MSHSSPSRTTRGLDPNGSDARDGPTRAFECQNVSISFETAGGTNQVLQDVDFSVAPMITQVGGLGSLIATVQQHFDDPTAYGLLAITPRAD